jgi:hypothetical protein
LTITNVPRASTACKAFSFFLKESTEFFKAGGADLGREGAGELPDEGCGRIVRTVAIVRVAIVRAVNRISTIVVAAE